MSLEGNIVNTKTPLIDREWNFINPYTTKALLQAEGFLFSDVDTPFPATVFSTVSSTWTHVAGEGWRGDNGIGNQGPVILYPLRRRKDWVATLEVKYSSAAANDVFQLMIGGMTLQNQVAFRGAFFDNSAVAAIRQTALSTNDGDDTHTNRYVGTPEAGDGLWTIRVGTENGGRIIWDDEDDAWHDSETRQSAGISYSSHWLFIQYRFDGNTPTVYLRSLGLSYDNIV